MTPRQGKVGLDPAAGGCTHPPRRSGAAPLPAGAPRAAARSQLGATTAEGSPPEARQPAARNASARARKAFGGAGFAGGGGGGRLSQRTRTARPRPRHRPPPPDAGREAARGPAGSPEPAAAVRQSPPPHSATPAAPGRRAPADGSGDEAGPGERGGGEGVAGAGGGGVFRWVPAQLQPQPVPTRTAKPTAVTQGALLYLFAQFGYVRRLDYYYFFLHLGGKKKNVPMKKVPYPVSLCFIWQLFGLRL